MRTGIELIASEQERQIHEERRGANGEYKYQRGELSSAAANYALASTMCSMQQDNQYNGNPPLYRTDMFDWPFTGASWNPGNQIKMLSIAGAFIAQELEHLIQEQGPDVVFTDDPAPTISPQSLESIHMGDFLPELKDMSRSELRQHLVELNARMEEDNGFKEAIQAELVGRRII
ncbi:hypothetical protein [Pseudovibrio sp. Ad37]|uniref:hypothetical protein n=1 Tax=Pseudovibrio sp. Ad37 TaxID=989422 RepID=UPI0007AE9ABC|nr:hypothetical protein [Pseudovibrio sp. Ad37]KZL24255.1 hypothetical protein PsAD37_02826 [Pseudovibrio sp. Ad37]